MKWLDDLIGENPSEDLSDYAGLYKHEQKETSGSLAHALYLASSKVDSLEWIIYELMEDSFKSGIQNIKSVDEYDYSIEFWIAKGTKLSEEDKKILKKMGFMRCWLCVKDGVKEDEVYYEF